MIGSRNGMGFLRFLVAVVVVAALLVLGFGILANRNAQVGDPAWWQRSGEQARPLVTTVRALSVEAAESIWGDDGWFDRGNDAVDRLRERREHPRTPTGRSQLHHRPKAEVQPEDQAEPVPDSSADASADAAPAAPAAPASPEPSPRSRRLAERIRTSEEVFAEAQADYRRGVARDGSVIDPEAATRAVAGFAQVHDLLVGQGTLDEYAGLDDHDPQLLAAAQDLARANEALLAAIR